MSTEKPHKLKTLIIAGTSVACLFTIYLLSSSSPVTENNATQTKENVDILYQDYPQGKNLCTADSFNSGKWVHQSIGLESPSIDGISSYAGYHCNWDFPHRCYRRTDQAGEFNRSKAM